MPRVRIVPGQEMYAIRRPEIGVTLDADWLGAHARLSKVPRAWFRCMRAGKVPGEGALRGVPRFWAYWGAHLHAWPASKEFYDAEVQ
jgi:hypothetical protein